MIQQINEMNSVTVHSMLLNISRISVIYVFDVMSPFFCSNPHSTLDESSRAHRWVAAHLLILTALLRERMHW
jgi:hypothetical protein